MLTDEAKQLFVIILKPDSLKLFVMNPFPFLRYGYQFPGIVKCLRFYLRFFSISILKFSGLLCARLKPLAG